MKVEGEKTRLEGEMRSKMEEDKIKLESDLKTRLEGEMRSKMEEDKIKLEMDMTTRLEREMRMKVEEEKMKLESEMKMRLEEEIKTKVEDEKIKLESEMNSSLEQIHTQVEEEKKGFEKEIETRLEGDIRTKLEEEKKEYEKDMKARCDDAIRIKVEEEKRKLEMDMTTRLEREMRIKVEEEKTKWEKQMEMRLEEEIKKKAEEEKRIYEIDIRTKLDEEMRAKVEHEKINDIPIAYGSEGTSILHEGISCMDCRAKEEEIEQMKEDWELLVNRLKREKSVMQEEAEVEYTQRLALEREKWDSERLSGECVNKDSAPCWPVKEDDCLDGKKCDLQDVKQLLMRVEELEEIKKTKEIEETRDGYENALARCLEAEKTLETIQAKNLLMTIDHEALTAQMRTLKDGAARASEAQKEYCIDYEKKITNSAHEEEKDKEDARREAVGEEAEMEKCNAAASYSREGGCEDKMEMHAFIEEQKMIISRLQDALNAKHQEAVTRKEEEKAPQDFVTGEDDDAVACAHSEVDVTGFTPEQMGAMIGEWLRGQEEEGEESMGALTAALGRQKPELISALTQALRGLGLNGAVADYWENEMAQCRVQAAIAENQLAEARNELSDLSHEFAMLSPGARQQHSDARRLATIIEEEECRSRGDAIGSFEGEGRDVVEVEARGYNSSDTFNSVPEPPLSVTDGNCVVYCEKIARDEVGTQTDVQDVQDVSYSNNFARVDAGTSPLSRAPVRVLRGFHDINTVQKTSMSMPIEEGGCKHPASPKAQTCMSRSASAPALFLHQKLEEEEAVHTVSHFSMAQQRQYTDNRLYLSASFEEEPRCSIEPYGKLEEPWHEGQEGHVFARGGEDDDACESVCLTSPSMHSEIITVGGNGLGHGEESTPAVQIIPEEGEKEGYFSTVVGGTKESSDHATDPYHIHLDDHGMTLALKKKLEELEGTLGQVIKERDELLQECKEGEAKNDAEKTPQEIRQDLSEEAFLTRLMEQSEKFEARLEEEKEELEQRSKFEARLEEEKE